MYKNNLSVKIKIDKPVFIDDNTVEMNWYINGVKQPKSLRVCNDGQGWHSVK